MHTCSELPEGSKSRSKAKRKFGIFICDQCSKKFERWVNVAKMLKKKFHFCSFSCVYAANKKGGIINRQRVATNLDRHGVEYVFTRPDVAREMIRRSNLPAAWEKRWQNMRRNGRANSSAPEEMMANLLIARYGIDEVERHSTNLSVDKRESIDFHVKRLDLYIQVDGEYWHGLDRPISEVMTRSGKHGDMIRRKWQRDRALDERCRKDGIHLTRITDREMKDPAWSFERWIKDLEHDFMHTSRIAS